MYEIHHIDCPDTNIFMIMFAFKVGSANETANVAGISHLVEHMVFESNKADSENLVSYGSLYNAFTSVDATCYFAKTTIEDALKVSKTFCKMFENLKVEKKTLEREKKVVIEEMMRGSTRDAIVNDADILHMGTPYANNVIGTEKSVKGISIRDLLEYYDNNYSDVQVVFSCNQMHEKQIRKIIKTFLPKRFMGNHENNENNENNERHEYTQNVLKPENVVPRCIVMKSINKTNKASEILISIKTTPYSHVKEREWYNAYAFTVKQMLFEELREKHGLMYGSFVNHECFRDSGILSVNLRNFLERKNINRVLQLVIQVMIKSVDHVESMNLSYQKYKTIQRSDPFISMKEKMWQVIFNNPKADYTKTNPKVIVVVYGDNSRHTKVDMKATDHALHKLVDRLSSVYLSSNKV